MIMNSCVDNELIVTYLKKMSERWYRNTARKTMKTVWISGNQPRWYIRKIRSESSWYRKQYPVIRLAVNFLSWKFNIVHIVNYLLLWALNFHQLAHKGPLFVHSLSHMNPLHTKPIHFNIILPSARISSKWFIFFGFSDKIANSTFILPASRFLCPRFNDLFSLRVI
jgi:hypothetical protein